MLPTPALLRNCFKTRVEYIRLDPGEQSPAAVPKKAGSTQRSRGYLMDPIKDDLQVVVHPIRTSAVLQHRSFAAVGPTFWYVAIGSSTHSQTHIQTNAHTHTYTNKHTRYVTSFVFLYLYSFPLALVNQSV